MKTIKTKLWLHIVNSGDGSCYVKFFNSEEEANKYADDHDNGERYCDDVYSKELEFDLDGKLLTKNAW
jgi:hypothetical protein